MARGGTGAVCLGRDGGGVTRGGTRAVTHSARLSINSIYTNTTMSVWVISTSTLWLYVILELAGRHR